MWTSRSSKRRWTRAAVRKGSQWRPRLNRGPRHAGPSRATPAAFASSVGAEVSAGEVPASATAREPAQVAGTDGGCHGTSRRRAAWARRLCLFTPAPEGPNDHAFGNRESGGNKRVHWTLAATHACGYAVPVHKHQKCRVVRSKTAELWAGTTIQYPRTA